MKEYVNWMDKLPLIIKIILALPGLDSIFYGLYRLFNGHIIAGIVWLLAGWAILWIVDIITIILSGRPTIFAK